MTHSSLSTHSQSVSHILHHLVTDTPDVLPRLLLTGVARPHDQSPHLAAILQNFKKIFLQQTTQGFNFFVLSQRYIRFFCIDTEIRGNKNSFILPS